MGCVASSIEKEERVRICKERKILMKQLLSLRGEFADAQLMYLRALKNTGVTLRQLTETESLELEYAPNTSIPLPASPPPPLPPSPPPPPTFSPDFRDSENSPKAENEQEETIEVYEEDSSVMPPPPPVLSSSWDSWDPFAASSPCNEKKTETTELLDEENWADTNTEFEEEGVENGALILLPEKPLVVDFGDDNSSMVSWQTREAADLAMVVWKSKKNLAGIMKDLDDYFLKASAVSTNIVIMVDVNSSDSFHGHNLEEKKSKYLCLVLYSTPTSSAICLMLLPSMVKL